MPFHSHYLTNVKWGLWMLYGILLWLTEQVFVYCVFQNILRLKKSYFFRESIYPGDL